MRANPSNLDRLNKAIATLTRAILDSWKATQRRLTDKPAEPSDTTFNMSLLLPDLRVAPVRFKSRY